MLTTKRSILNLFVDKYRKRIFVCFFFLFIEHQAFAGSHDIDGQKDIPKISWAGFYAGASLGANWSSGNLSANNGGFVTDSGGYSGDFNVSTIDPGVQLGYLYQFENGTVLGGEGDFTYPGSNYNLTGKTSCCSYDQFNVRYNLQGSLRLRYGYAFDSLLPYVTAGVSFGSMGLSYSNEQNNSYSVNTTQTGWVLGGGLEYKLLESYSVRIEYLHIDYGTALNLSLPMLYGVSDPQGVARSTMAADIARMAFNFSF